MLTDIMKDFLNYTEVKTQLLCCYFIVVIVAIVFIFDDAVLYIVV